MRMRFRFALTVLCLGLVVCCAESAATTIETFSIEKMAMVAQTIVRATCTSNVTRWERGEIWTVTTFNVAETWKGREADQVSVRLLGGTVAGLTSNVSGVPRFRIGEDVILFLEPTKHGGMTIVSWQQGTFRLRRDVSTGQTTVTPDTATLETFDPQTRSFRATAIRNCPLEQFRRRVQAAIAALLGGKS